MALSTESNHDQVKSPLGRGAIYILTASYKERYYFKTALWDRSQISRGHNAEPTMFLLE